jgi:membrane dipeptidase
LAGSASSLERMLGRPGILSKEDAGWTRLPHYASRMSFHDDCLVFDGHTDVPSRLWESPADLSQPLPDRHIDLPRLRRGGVDALVFALYVPASLSVGAGREHARTLYEVARAQLGSGSGGSGLVQATSVAEVRRAADRREVAVVFGLENGRPLGAIEGRAAGRLGEPGFLGECSAMGVRYVTLTHNASHEWCDASTGEALHGGLAPEGIAILQEMSRRGILADVSHVSDAGVAQVLAVSPLPPVASHSSARALCDVPRNLPDDLIRDIARRGGVVMANSYAAFVGPAAARANQERMRELGPALAELEEPYLREPTKIREEIVRLFDGFPLPAVPLSAFVDHVVRLIELGGEEHVGIGTDFDGIDAPLEGFEDPSRFPDLTAALLDRGVDRAGVRLILGENFLRLLTLAEKAAS